ncbi:YebC/PmpR family DNA-binding transcriptional regulator [Leucothrix arctica]|uniref:Probable transcriptional regulatory protein DKT75_14860 n=1 Tax=Leucothrix arctica TaxID=1481894 RepID=A0A317C7G3_9GAMM|nr:YebC/PmpR family DNA-binding transcriptional regulator [Leucothrix arctica]PWQ94574.1 YebC/PmpR family DNA-binding transcriptional regulator [Leucothrix arctica]
MGRAYQNRKESMAKTSDQKARVYSKYGREIYVCAKAGGVDTDGNLALRSLIDKAKKDQVPTHVIDKAIDKAKGGGGEDFAPARYEGYGPGSCMAIIECLTDNPNRTFGDVRVCFTKTNSKIGTQGSVSHMFDHLSIFVFAGDDEEAILDALMEADVDVTDIESDGGKISVFAPDDQYGKTRQAIVATIPDVDFDVDEIQFLPQAETKLTDEEDIAMFEKFMDMLNELDDVQNVYHNVEV